MFVLHPVCAVNAFVERGVDDAYNGLVARTWNIREHATRHAKVPISPVASIIQLHGNKVGSTNPELGILLPRQQNAGAEHTVPHKVVNANFMQELKCVATGLVERYKRPIQIFILDVLWYIKSLSIEGILYYLRKFRLLHRGYACRKVVLAYVAQIVVSHRSAEVSFYDGCALPEHLFGFIELSTFDTIGDNMSAL